MKGMKLNSNEPADFKSDLGEAHQLEDFIGQWAAKELDGEYQTTAHLGAFSGYDVDIKLKDGQSIKIEVKMDKKVEKTGNVAVEYKRTHKSGFERPTCVEATAADWWCYYFMGTFHFIETSTLKKIIADKLYTRIVEGAGDGNRSSCYLFPKDVFIKHCILVTYE